MTISLSLSFSPSRFPFCVLQGESSPCEGRAISYTSALLKSRWTERWILTRFAPLSSIAFSFWGSGDIYFHLIWWLLAHWGCFWGAPNGSFQWSRRKSPWELSHPAGLSSIWRLRLLGPNLFTAFQICVVLFHQLISLHSCEMSCPLPYSQAGRHREKLRKTRHELRWKHKSL